MAIPRGVHNFVAFFFSITATETETVSLELTLALALALGVTRRTSCAGTSEELDRNGIEIK
jgi:hypothetical protein